MAGHFDPEENSLRGTVTWEGGKMGEFVFKRDPDFVRFYPAPSTIDAYARWKFATAAILDRIRRQSWSTSYILKRIKDGKRYMELAIRAGHYGQGLDDDESDEYNNLLASLYEADSRFYSSLINIKLSGIPIQYVDGCLWGLLVDTHRCGYSPIGCDACGALLGGARVLCMDCHGESTVDLCSEPECLNSVVTLERHRGLMPPHTPNHNVLKVHRILFNRDSA